jgi:hypothetical protein
MSKDTPLNDLPTAQVNESLQNSMDSFGNIHIAPVRKLDADEYTANDLDGVTESATGSGNLNFLMMQAGQTNEAMSNLNPFNTSGGDGNPYFNAINGTGGGSFGPIGGTDNSFDTAMDRGFDRGGDVDGQSQLNNTGNSSSNAGSLGVSNLVANATASNPLTSVSNFSSSSSSGGPPVVPTNGVNGTNGLNADGKDGSDGSNGTPGTPGLPGDGTTIINIDDRVYETIENIVNETVTNLGDVINHTTTHLGDIVNHTTTNIFDTVNNTTNNLGDIINQTTTNLGDVVNNITTNLGDVLNQSTTNIFDTVNNVTNNVSNILNNIINNNGGGLGPIGLNLDLLVDNITNINLDIINGTNITNVLNETLNTAPILVPVQDLLGNLLSHTSLDVLINPFQPDTGAGDTDLHVGTNLDVLGIHIPNIGIDIPLDIAEGLLGDIDINLDLTNDILGGLPILGDLLGGGHGNGDTDLAVGGLGGILNADALNDAAQTLLNPVENLVGDIDIGGAIGLDLLGLNSGETGPDTDISIPLDIGFIDSPLLQDGLNISLDPLEQIVGDIDLDLGVAGNILGNVAPNLFDNALGGNGQNDLLAQIGDGLSGVVGGILPIGSGADTDLALGTGIDLLDNHLADNGLGLVLDPVENLVGDIDIGGAIGLDLLGNANSGGTDSDITLPVDFYIVDAPLLNDGLDINLDPLESIVGDIDINLGVAGDLLGNTAPNMFDDLHGGSGSNDLLSQVGDGLSDIGHHLLPFGDGNDSDITLGTGVDAGGFDAIANSADIVLDPVETITGDIDLNGALGLDLLGTGGGTGPDTDLSIDTGIIAPVHINLDGVESIVGDIDLGLDLHSAIGDAVSAVIAPLTPAIDETLHNIDIFGGAATDGIDTTIHSIDDITGGLGLDNILGGGSGGLSDALHSAITLLDSSSPSTGGLDLGAITGGLGGGATDPIGAITTWTETVLPNAGDLLGGGLHVDPVAHIPDPVMTTPVLSLPAVPAVTSVPIVGGLLGGLGGHHGHGGLFG